MTKGCILQHLPRDGREQAVLQSQGGRKGKREGKRNGGWGRRGKEERVRVSEELQECC